MSLVQNAVIKSRKQLLIALSLSIALNIFAATLIGGALMGKDALLLIAARSQLRNALKDLPSEKQAAFRDIFRDHVRPNLAQLKADNKNNTLSLTKDMLNAGLTREMLENDFARIRESEVQTRAKNQAYYTDFILSLSPDERKAFAEGIQRVVQ